MIAEERVIEREGNLSGETVAMGVDASALRHIMSVLTDLYSDPETAVIREYSTNARDAHVEAGIPERPIEVDTPSPLSPCLRIRDYGVGLSAEDIRSIYSQYGASTKRGSNDYTGMLGLGCKSALTYCDQFTLTGWKDGEVIQVAIGRESDGGGSMTILHRGPTDEPNGVEILIPARSDNNLEAKARHFFRYWDEGTVLLNGTAPERVDGIWLGDGRYLIARDRISEGVVMGGVHYPHNWWPQLGWGHSAVLFAEIGEFSPVPSRESLQDTPLSKAALDAARAEADELLQAYLADWVEEAQDTAEALDRWSSAAALRQGGRAQVWTWRNRPIPNAGRLTRALKSGDTRTPFLTWRQQGRKAGGKTNTVNLLNVGGMVIVEGFTYNGLTPTRVLKLQQHHRGKGATQNANNVLLVDKLYPDERFWLTRPDTVIYQWADIEKEVLPKAAKGTSGSKSTDVRYPASPPGGVIHQVGREWRRGREYTADEIPKNETILYVEGGFNAVQWSPQTMRGLPDDLWVVGVSSPRVAKFLRLFPKARSAAEYMKEQAEAWFKAINPLDLKALVLVAKRPYEHLAGIDASLLDDPEIAAYKALRKRKVAHLERAYQLYSWYVGWTGSDIELPENPLKKYPLISNGVNGATPEHVALYINAVYAAQHKEDA